MATVIDSLVVLLNLDASKFSAQQKKALEDLRKVKDEASSTGKGMEASGEQASEFFVLLRNEALKLTAVVATLVGFKGLGAFTAETTRLTAEQGRLAYNTGQTTQEVSTWEQVVKRFGGNAEEAGQSMYGLSQALSQFKLTGQSDVVPYFRALGVGLVNLDTGKIKTVTELYIDLADAIQKQHIAPEEANFLLHAIGLDQGTINIIEQGSDAVRKQVKIVEAQKKANDADSKSLQQLQTAYEDFASVVESVGRRILVASSGVGSSILNILTRSATHTLDPSHGWGFITGADWFNRNFGTSGQGQQLSLFDLIQKLEGSGPNAISSAGAVGRNQITEDTAHTYGFDYNRLKTDPEYNDQAARAIEGDLYRRYKGDTDAIAIAYHSGPGAADRYLAAGRDASVLGPEGRKYLAHEQSITGGANSTVISIGSISVITRATDAAGIAGDIRGALTGSLATQGNQGPQ